jgi:hypothetical protein
MRLRHRLDDVLVVVQITITMLIVGLTIAVLDVVEACRRRRFTSSSEGVADGGTVRKAAGKPHES